MTSPHLVYSTSQIERTVQGNYHIKLPKNIFQSYTENRAVSLHQLLSFLLGF